MKFQEALTALDNGKKVTRTDDTWENYFLAVSEEYGGLTLFSTVDGWCDTQHPVNARDLIANDWEIVP